MHRLPASMLSIALFCAPLAVSAQVYTWTDAHGTVHYADAPPAHGAHYKNLPIPGATAVSAPTPEADAADTDSATATATRRQPDTPANRGKLCDNLKVNMKLLEKTGPVVMRDKHGKNQLLSKQDRADELARERQTYQAHCTG